MMVSVQEALNQTNDRLSQAGIETARLDARLLIEHVLRLAPHEVNSKREQTLAVTEYERLQALVRRRAKREPLAYIVAEREFWSLPFIVSKATLVPRPDSETLIEAALARFQDRNVCLSLLDLGTGSGCLLLSLLHELPRSTGIGIDCCPEALTIARQNAKRLSLSDRASFVCADWGKGLSTRFDIIVCNPPYIPQGELEALMPEVSHYEPRHALSGGMDGLESYRKVASVLPGMMQENGLVILEIGINQTTDVSNILTGNGLQVIESKRDLSGLPRCIIAQRAC